MAITVYVIVDSLEMESHVQVHTHTRFSIPLTQQPSVEVTFHNGDKNPGNVFVMEHSRYRCRGWLESSPQIDVT